jgi:hypothetical protein
MSIFKIHMDFDTWNFRHVTLCIAWMSAIIVIVVHDEDHDSSNGLRSMAHGPSVLRRHNSTNRNLCRVTDTAGVILLSVARVSNELRLLSP